MKSRYVKAIVCILVLLLHGCAMSPSVPPVAAPLQQHLANEPTAQCAAFFLAMDQAAVEHDAYDGANMRVPGFPYLRTNRFYLSFRNQVLDGPMSAFNAWLDYLQALDRHDRDIEIANLPSREQQVLLQRFAADRQSLTDLVRSCGDTLRRHDFTEMSQGQALPLTEDYPEDYQTVKRFFGIYAISSLFVKIGVNKLHHEFRDVFDTPLAQLPVRGELIRYEPAMLQSVPALTADEVSDILRTSSHNTFQIPQPDHEQLARLFSTFAPVLEVETLGDFDMPGSPVWQDGDVAQIDTTRPVINTLVSYTRFGGRNLLQLVYVMWFQERPLDGLFDILGGHMDGITWRVTLGTDGRPVMYDTMHNCGCYHMFFPHAGLARKKVYGVYQEVPLVPRVVSRTDNARPVLRIESGTHYLQKLHFDVTSTPQVRQYQVADYDMLRSLPYADRGRKSLFSWDGIVKGTERAERWILWPMGVPEPGAMRQWGRHATAFIGKRHFDDAFMLERYFRYE